MPDTVLSPSSGIEAATASHVVLEYALARFDFVHVIAESLGESDLNRLGESECIALRTRETDQSTRWHHAFYDGFDTWRSLYDMFVREVVAPLFNERFFYQAVPTLRVHLQNNVAVGEFHTDRDYGHPERELTFWVPLTRAFGTNSLWIESALGRGDYGPVTAGPGEMVAFDASTFRHGNYRNTSGQTRVSFDFRCLCESDFRETGRRSINVGLEFAPGGYYAPEPVEPRS